MVHLSSIHLFVLRDRGMQRILRLVAGPVGPVWTADRVTDRVDVLGIIIPWCASKSFTTEVYCWWLVYLVKVFLMLRFYSSSPANGDQ